MPHQPPSLQLQSSWAGVGRIPSDIPSFTSKKENSSDGKLTQGWVWKDAWHFIKKGNIWEEAATPRPCSCWRPYCTVLQLYPHAVSVIRRTPRQPSLTARERQREQREAEEILQFKWSCNFRLRCQSQRRGSVVQAQKTLTRACGTSPALSRKIPGPRRLVDKLNGSCWKNLANVQHFRRVLCAAPSSHVNCTHSWGETPMGERRSR